MNFFAAQDNAKKKTRYLILVYLLVLVVLTLLSTLVLLLLFPVAIGKPLPSPILPWLFSQQNLPTLLGVGAFVIGGALISSYIKSRHLSKGGGVIAAALGGVKIAPDTTDFNERKVLNVVEEMAIASGMPVPEVYLLKQESAINAFAAGQTPMDAVIGVTQGTIDKLTRAQLQGVIGHEFSHILNGDMRLNLRLIMLLHGIEFIALLGRILSSSQRNRRVRSSSSRRKGNGGAIVLAGLALRLIGWFGILFGNLIQAAVSRQREFLADASSVQFTRDPTAISGALKVIGGVSESSRIKNADVGEVAHLFFGQAFITRFTYLFATHPPIDQRIRTIEPGWDGQYLKAAMQPIPQDHPSSEQARSLPEPLQLLLAAGITVHLMPEGKQSQLSKLVQDANETLPAMALLLALLIDAESSNANKSWQGLVQKAQIKGLDELVGKYLLELAAIDLQNTLPLIELSMPALKQMSAEQYERFKSLLDEIIMLDGERSIFEQSVYLLVSRYLDVHFGLAKAVQVKYRRASMVAMELQMVLSLLTHYGHQDAIHEQVAVDAFKKAVKHLGLPELELMGKDAIDEALFKRATEKLIFCSLPLKQKIAESLSICIHHDGEVNPVEKELVLAMAATMDAPLPRITI